MAGATKQLSHLWQPVAQGAGNARIVVQLHPGQYTIHTSVDPAGITGDGFPLYIGVTETVTLGASQFLHMRGRMGAYVEADTLI